MLAGWGLPVEAARMQAAPPLAVVVTVTIQLGILPWRCRSIYSGLLHMTIHGHEAGDDRWLL
jgi:hypothetical protein